MKSLYFFTNSYPYDTGVQWKTNELLVLKKYFNIVVVPFVLENERFFGKKIAEINYSEPLFKKINSVNIKTRFFIVLFSKHFFFFLKEFFNKKVYKNKTNIIQWIAASYRILMLEKNKRLKNILNQIKKDDILYFFWGKETSEIIPVLKIKTNNKIIVRYHGYDLYEDRNYNYIPYRKQQLKKIHTALFVSEQGKKYLINKYKNINFNAEIFRLGTTEEGKSKISNDGILRIFSCSSIIPLKRVNLIGEAVVKLSFPVKWIHIGGGKQLESIKKKFLNSPKNITICFTGQVNNKEVRKYFVDKPADLFINVSITEGVPISIMEAMSAGIPVFATDVGGTSEIVNSENGKLLPADLTPEYLAEQISNFYTYSDNIKFEFRKKAYNKFQEMCNGKLLAEQFADFLKTL